MKLSSQTRVGFARRVLGLAGIISIAIMSVAAAETRLNEFWVPATIAKLETYYGNTTLLVKREFSYFYVSDFDATRWVNIPVTNPSITENTDNFLTCVYPQFGFGYFDDDNPNQVTITSVEILDGNELVAAFEDKPGDDDRYKFSIHRCRPDGDCLPIMCVGDVSDEDRYQVKSGLNVRLRIEFSPTTDRYVNWVKIYGVGVGLERSW